MKVFNSQVLQRVFLFTVIGCAGIADESRAEGPSIEISGAAQLDYVQDFNRVDPDWEATLRPSRIPTSDGVFGSDGQAITSVRQSRLAIAATQDVAGRPFTVKFDFDLFGTGDDAGATTFHLQNFYGSWGPLLAGKTNTVFMDGSTFPNTIDYWGPPGMVYVRNPQIRLTYKRGAHAFAIAIEEPSDDVDPGGIRLIDPEIGAGLQGDEKYPDLTGHYRYEGGWGNAQIAGILRRVGYETAGAPGNEPQGGKTGWGVNLTLNTKVIGKDTLHLATVYGEGIASYMNDGGVDLAPNRDIVTAPGGGPALRVTAEPVPLFGLVAYYDHYWNDSWSTAVGYSRTHVDNTSFQAPSAFKVGEYASVNLLYTPADQVMMGGEVLWGRREDKNGKSGEDTRVQLSFRYSFSSKDFFK